MDFLNSKIGQPFLDGIESDHILGEMVPVRAVPGYDYDEDEEVTGRALVITEVVPWMHDEDDEGVAFDRANLCGVRNFCLRRPLADGGGDDNDWVAVPRSLPGGYTAVGRCGILIPGLYADHIGDTGPYTAQSWNHRTHTGLLWDTSDPEQAARSQWAPMNRNQLTLNGSIGPFSWGAAYPEDDEDPEWALNAIPIAGLASSHIGFRGGRIELTFINAGPFWPHTVRRNFTIACWPITDDPWIYAEHPPANKEDLHTINASHEFTTPGADYTETFDLPELKPSQDGIPCHFYLVGRTSNEEGPDDYNVVFLGRFSFAYYLSPRTDVPLWYFASMGNRVAPGGIIIP